MYIVPLTLIKGRRYLFIDIFGQKRQVCEQKESMGGPLLKWKNCIVILPI